jgi:hypothetical protein
VTVAKRGEPRPFTVRFRFEGGREWAFGSYATRESAEFYRDQQAARIGPDGQTCEAWIVDRRPTDRPNLSPADRAELAAELRRLRNLRR